LETLRQADPSVAKAGGSALGTASAPRCSSRMKERRGRHGWCDPI